MQRNNVRFGEGIETKEAAYGFGLQLECAKLKRPKTEESWEDLWYPRAIRSLQNDDEK